MPILVACPKCHGKLRVADELRGQRLRCPACDHTFESDAASPSPSPSPDPAPLEPRDLPLRLTLDETDSTSSAANGQRGLVGAVEVSRPIDDGSPAPPAELPPPAPRPLLNDEHEDLKQCPQCGVHVHRDSTRCYHCGERFTGNRRDWEEPDLRRRPRRDAEPDRGVLILVLGILSLACITFSCVPVGTILGLIAWIMGQIDLRKMKRGTMDDNGRSMTQAGWICGLIGTILNGLLTLLCLSFIGFFWYMDVSRPPRTGGVTISRPIQQGGPPLPNNQPLKK